MALLEVGPLPRGRPRFTLSPSDVFQQGIPGLSGTEWLQADVVAFDFDLAMASTPSGATSVEGVETVCEASDVNDAINSTNTQFATFYGDALIRCPVRVSGAERQQWIDSAVGQLVDHVLDGAVSGHAASVSAETAADWPEALISAETHLNTHYGFGGMIGLPPAALVMLQDQLHYEGAAVYSPAGHRVWSHYDTSTVDGIIATSDIFYAEMTDEYEAFELPGNVHVRKATTYVKAVHDLEARVVTLEE